MMKLIFFLIFCMVSAVGSASPLRLFFEVSFSSGDYKEARAYINPYIINDGAEKVVLALGADGPRIVVKSGDAKNRIHSYYFYVGLIEDGGILPVKHGLTAVNPVVLSPNEAAPLRGLIIEGISEIESLMIFYRVEEKYGSLHGVWSGTLHSTIAFFDEEGLPSHRFTE